MKEKTEKARLEYFEVKKEAGRIRVQREKEKGNEYRVLLFRLNGLLGE